nr:ATP-binding cassette domain-containing protein [Natronorubrum halophilum]
MWKEYDSNVAVDSLTLALDTGSIYGFFGPTGAGKTTTMHLLTTLAKPTARSARVAGHPLSDREGVRSQIGYLPEEPPDELKRHIESGEESTLENAFLEVTTVSLVDMAA